jgi:hypothetical protein
MVAYNNSFEILMRILSGIDRKLCCSTRDDAFVAGPEDFICRLNAFKHWECHAGYCGWNSVATSYNIVYGSEETGWSIMQKLCQLARELRDPWALLQVSNWYVNIVLPTTCPPPTMHCAYYMPTPHYALCLLHAHPCAYCMPTLHYALCLLHAHPPLCAVPTAVHNHMQSIPQFGM